MANYWIVYSKVDTRAVSNLCIEHGIWFANAETTRGRIEKIERDDSLALKLGGRIIALGVVKDTTSLRPYRLIFVNWTQVDKEPPFRRIRTLHGPYNETHKCAKLSSVLSCRVQVPAE